MSTWAEDELARIGAAYELRVSTLRADGTLRTGIPIWQVRVGDAIYIRSAHGPDNGWFRRATAAGLGRISSGDVEKDVTFEQTEAMSDEITTAYHDKYDGYGPGPVGAVTGDDVLETTLRVMPRDSNILLGERTRVTPGPHPSLRGHPVCTSGYWFEPSIAHQRNRR